MLWLNFAPLLSLTEEHAGVARAGRPAGVLMLTGNAGGVVVVIAMESVKGANWMGAVYLMPALMLVTAVLALPLGEPPNPAAQPG